MKSVAGRALFRAAIALCLPFFSPANAAHAQAVPSHRPVAGQHPQPPVAADGYAWQLFLPVDYIGAGEQRRWPLILFLHGSGERGDDIAKVKVHGPPKVADRDPAFPFVTVSPLLPAGQDWDVPKLEAILDHVVTRYRVDPERIYLTGLSRGAHASWRWAAAAPGRFAAVVPVSGRGDPSTACRLKDMPVWAFHGDRDDVVTPFGSFMIVEAIRSCGGKPRFTIYPDTGHDAWTRTYDDPALYDWLLSHRRAPQGEAQPSTP